MVRSSRVRRIRLILGAFGSFLWAASAVHCAAGDEADGGGDSGFGGGQTGPAGPAGAGGAQNGSSGSPGAGGDGGELGIDVQGKDYTADQFFEDDPPPMGCDGGGQPKVPGGTPECPDDKNLEGCPCPVKGEKAACWPGKRKNRNKGICHDGTTECKLVGESQLVWGPCEGYQLPTGTTGKAACLCFSGGHWDVDNLSPCFFTNPNDTIVAVSTIMVNGQPQCPASADAPPAEPWSTNRLKVDCTGYFKLCYALKAGDGDNPKPTDCEIAKVCTEAYYGEANTVMDYPPLPSWLSTPAVSACVKQFVDSGGYGEMSVVGESDECDKVDKVFQRVTYCPLSCNGPNPPPECASCVSGGGGDF